MELTMAFLVAVIIGLETAFKGMGLPPKLVPALNLVLGLGGALLYSLAEPMSLTEMIFFGVVAGLTASGAYSGVKNTAEAIKGDG